jgi:hypothetical protein
MSLTGLLFAFILLALPGTALAHSFGRLYVLPVPLWMYAYGAAAALLLSFLVIAYFTTAATHDRPSSPTSRPAPHWLGYCYGNGAMVALKVASVLGLLLCVLSGFIGHPNPYLNFSMTFFWIVFVLGFAYLTAVIGDVYAAINPWRTLTQLLDRVIRGFAQGRLHYPSRLGYWPALVLYGIFIGIELLASTGPFSLATLLSAYTVINLVGVWLIGGTAWFRYCEFFAVFLRLLAKMAPVDFQPDEGRARLRLRLPFAGLLHERTESYSLLLFVLFMLSSTAFDGLRATVLWYEWAWQPLNNLVAPLLGGEPLQNYLQLRRVFRGLEALTLAASPFLYLAVYLIFILLAQRITRSPHSVRELALQFGLSLLPIALVYNITHYYTLVLSQGLRVINQISDPFGWGWNLFGTANLLRAPILPDMAFVWHSQVALIVFGHIVSVYLAHRVALRVFATPRQATLSQLPMLVLMMAFTTSGLWILAQPIKAGG